MKITATQYAKSLYEVTREKSQSEIGVVVENFVKVLAKNRQIKLVVDIIKKFEELYNRENNIAEVEATSREKLSGELVDKLINFVQEKYKVNEVVINNKIDEKIGGGIILKIGGEVMDGSIIEQLKNLRKSLLQ